MEAMVSRVRGSSGILTGAGGAHLLRHFRFVELLEERLGPLERRARHGSFEGPSLTRLQPRRPSPRYSCTRWELPGMKGYSAVLSAAIV